LGLPGVGKTTRARELASTDRVLRLTPDEWMAPLFRESEVDTRCYSSGRKDRRIHDRDFVPSGRPSTDSATHGAVEPSR
jgi:predicted kinase